MSLYPSRYLALDQAIWQQGHSSHRMYELQKKGRSSVRSKIATRLRFRGRVHAYITMVQASRTHSEFAGPRSCVGLPARPRPCLLSPKFRQVDDLKLHVSRAPPFLKHPTVINHSNAPEVVGLHHRSRSQAFLYSQLRQTHSSVVVSSLS
jgi:hypothetical protein